MIGWLCCWIGLAWFGLDHLRFSAWSLILPDFASDLQELHRLGMVASQAQTWCWSGHALEHIEALMGEQPEMLGLVFWLAQGLTSLPFIYWGLSWLLSDKLYNLYTLDIIIIIDHVKPVLNQRVCHGMTLRVSRLCQSMLSARPETPQPPRGQHPGS